MLCCKKKKNVGLDSGSGTKDWELKPFNKTFKIITFFMVMGIIYPNPANEKTRFKIIMSIYVTIIPALIIVSCDMLRFWNEGAIQEIIRHGTMLVPFTVMLCKLYIMYHYRVLIKGIIDEIDRDHNILNAVPAHHRPVVEKHLATNFLMERSWLITICLVVLIFPIMATLLNFYSFTFKEEPRKYMIHDMNPPFRPPETRFDWPYFEIMYPYEVYIALLYFINYVGFDGFFGIVINHACLKIKMNCLALEDAFKLAEEDVYEKLVEFIRAQVGVYSYVETIQQVFNFWLGMIVSGTLIHLCLCMYQISEGLGMDLKYLIFIVGSTIHIFLPCSYSTKLRTASEETATHIYSCGWENVCSLRIRKMLIFMIASAQRPVSLTAFNILNIDMELFVSIMQKSYSIYTLLSTT